MAALVGVMEQGKKRKKPRAELGALAVPEALRPILAAWAVHDSGYVDIHELNLDSKKTPFLASALDDAPRGTDRLLVLGETGDGDLWAIDCDQEGTAESATLRGSTTLPAVALTPRRRGGIGMRRGSLRSRQEE